jgi:hypothetical protein
VTAGIRQQIDRILELRGIGGHRAGSEIIAAAGRKHAKPDLVDQLSYPCRIVMVGHHHLIYQETK